MHKSWCFSIMCFALKKFYISLNFLMFFFFCPFFSYFTVLFWFLVYLCAIPKHCTSIIWVKWNFLSIFWWQIFLLFFLFIFFGVCVLFLMFNYIFVFGFFFCHFFLFLSRVIMCNTLALCKILVRIMFAFWDFHVV